MADKTYKDMDPDMQMEYIRMKLSSTILQFGQLCADHGKDVNEELLALVKTNEIIEKLGGVLELKRKMT